MAIPIGYFYTRVNIVSFIRVPRLFVTTIKTGEMKPIKMAPRKAPVIILCPPGGGNGAFKGCFPIEK